MGWKYGANGHAALSLGDGTIATTDPSSDQGMTGIEDITWPQKWGAGSTWSACGRDQYSGVRFDVGRTRMEKATCGATTAGNPRAP